MGKITLANGHLYDILQPSPEEVYRHRRQLGFALGRICRYNGHLPNGDWVQEDRVDFYSVAEHCLLGMQLVPEELQLEFLVHDLPEAMGIGDVVAPLKPHLGAALADLETRAETAVAEAFKLRTDPEAREIVKHADKVMWVTEEVHLRGGLSKYGPEFVQFEKLEVDMKFPLWPPHTAGLKYTAALDRLLYQRGGLRG